MAKKPLPPKPPPEFEVTIKGVPISLFVTEPTSRFGRNSTPKIVIDGHVNKYRDPDSNFAFQNVMHELCDKLKASYSSHHAPHDGCVVSYGSECVTWKHTPADDVGHEYYAFDIPRALPFRKNSDKSRAALDRLKNRIITKLEELHAQYGSGEPDRGKERALYIERNTAPGTWAAKHIRSIGNEDAAVPGEAIERMEQNVLDVFVRARALFPPHQQATLDMVRDGLIESNARLMQQERPSRIGNALRQVDLDRNTENLFEQLEVLLPENKHIALGALREELMARNRQVVENIGSLENKTPSAGDDQRRQI